MIPAALRASVLLALVAPVVSAADGIVWETKLEAAQARVKEENKVLFLAVNMDGERASERMVDKVYKDKSIVALAGATLNLVASTAEHAPLDRTCPKFPGLHCLDHRRVDSAARDAILKPDAQGFVVAPQQVFLAPDGKVILSVPYEVTVPELEWCFVTALRTVDPQCKATMSPAARAPKQVILGGVFDPKSAPEGAGRTPTRVEVIELIKQVKKGLPGEERLETLRRILLSDEPEAIEFIRTELRSGQGGRGGGGGGGKGGGLGGGLGGQGGQGGGEDGSDRRAKILHAIGALSPPAYWEVVAEYADNGEAPLRHEAAVALEQLGAPESLKTVQTALGKEEDKTLAKDWLRALGTTGAADTHARALLLKKAHAEKDELLRANAIVALGSVNTGDDVHDTLGSALKTGPTSDQAAAACAMAITRDPRWLVELEAAAQGSPDPLVGEACAAATASLTNGGLRAIRAVLKKVAQDTVERDRWFGNVPQ
jgi:hypothetical protein